MTWQPIETAPKGETHTVAAGKGEREVHTSPRILAPTSDGNVTITYWLDAEQRWWMFSRKHPPTHWMPLPEPPK